MYCIFHLFSETNVSVYIKRGVFDDDVSNDLVDMRRGGGQAKRLAEEENCELLVSFYTTLECEWI